MNIPEIMLIGIGLSMDAIAVSVSNVMAYRKTRKAVLIAMPLFFGLFQGIMPMLGYFTGSLFYEVIRKSGGFVTLVILGIIGAKMIKDSKAEDSCCKYNSLTCAVLLLQAVATSVDAFAVGVSFCATETPIIYSALMIACITFLLTATAGIMGKKAEMIPQDKAMKLGGAVLVIIGLKAFLSGIRL